MRNAESRFAINPTKIDMQRSRFDRNSQVTTSFNVGDIVPFYLDEVLPGDTFQIQTNKVIRFQTLLSPIMSNLYLDTYYFFVPNRLVWKHWKEFMGENTESAWIPSTTYTIPQIVSPSSTGFAVGTIADYLGVPTGVPNLSMSALPFRAYALIMNEWFRDENLMDPLVIPDDETTVTGVNTGTFVSDVAKGGLPYIASKYHDYFTSCLPSAQKGPPVEIPVADVGNLPVVGLEDFNIKDYSGGNIHFAETTLGNIFKANGNLNITLHGNGSDPSYLMNTTGSTSGSIDNALSPTNLWAINSGSASAATINQLRLAFQIQKWYEAAARGGTRYIETLRAHFGVVSPDSRLQRPEYLGGNRLPIHISQVIQNSGTESGTTPQGTTTAFSLTTDRHSDFVHSFTEHGYVIGVMVARYDHSYQQGLERHWSRKSLFDYYWPEFANLGEQAVLNKEIYAQDDSVIGVTGDPENEEVFGYQERWAEYRYKPSHITGEMRSTYATSLDVWHLGDDYSSLPSLSDSWIREDKTTVDRVLAVASTVSNQILADLYVMNRTTRPMPMYSIPGLIDHH